MEKREQRRRGDTQVADDTDFKPTGSPAPLLLCPSPPPFLLFNSSPRYGRYSLSRFAPISASVYQARRRRCPAKMRI